MMQPDFCPECHLQASMPDREEMAIELRALRAFVREVANQDPAQPTGQRQSNKERAEDLCEQWGIIA